jgi:hypothetical protein
VRVQARKLALHVHDQSIVQDTFQPDIDRLLSVVWQNTVTLKPHAKMHIVGHIFQSSILWLAFESFRFFMWGYLKNNVCAATIDTREELWHQIQHFAHDINNTPGVFKWVHISLSFLAEMCSIR